MKDYLIGQVNSPVRSCQAVGGPPIQIVSGHGPFVRTLNGTQLVDFILGWGALALGHAHPALVAAIQTAAANGSVFGMTTPSEFELAAKIHELMPHLHKIRFVNSGSEATATAIRLARGFTKRPIIVKCEGGYHGAIDGLLINAGPDTAGIPGSAGIPDSIAALTHVIPYNNPDAVRQIFADRGDQIAGVIVEPVAGNMGVVVPDVAFLAELRTQCTHHNAILIFDEVMTGFRVAVGGAAAHFGIIPDLTCLGKIIGGGLPIGAIGGSEPVMNFLAPVGPVYSGGTFSGNPLTMAAGIAMMTAISDSWQVGTEYVSNLISQIKRSKTNRKLQINYIGTMWSIFFTESPVTDYQSAKQCEPQIFRQFFHHLRHSGFLIAPSQWESNFMSSAHTPDIIAETATAINHFLGVA